jgi:predicted transcriptional regulator
MKGRDFCELSEEEIADDCNIHVLAVPKYINSLERKGLITVDQEERWLPCPILNKGKKGKIQYAAYRIYTINWRRKLNQLGIRYK